MRLALILGLTVSMIALAGCSSNRRCCNYKTTTCNTYQSADPCAAVGEWEVVSETYDNGTVSTRSGGDVVYVSRPAPAQRSRGVSVPPAPALPCATAAAATCKPACKPICNPLKALFSNPCCPGGVCGIPSAEDCCPGGVCGIPQATYECK